MTNVFIVPAYTLEQLQKINSDEYVLNVWDYKVSMECKSTISVVDAVRCCHRRRRWRLEEKKLKPALAKPILCCKSSLS